MRYLAIDYGNKRTGLAICDESQTIVSPFAVLDTNNQLAEKITQIINDEAIAAAVIGLPLNMDDTEGPQAKIVRNFAAQLKKRIDIEIHFEDERLSSFGAAEKIAAADFTRKKKKKRLDAIGPSIPDSIGVYGDKQVCIFCVCDGGSFLQRQVSIAISGHDDLTTQLFANFFCKPPGQFQDNVFFMNPP